MTTFTTFLWFDSQAQEAAEYYTSIFENGKINRIRHYSSSPDDAGSIMTVDFQLDGQSFSALNAGAGDPFTEAMSIEVRCDTQADVDRYWDRLTDGGEEKPCGWLKDRFGVSWQVIPKLLFELLDDPDAAKRQAVFAAMLGMGKIESRALQEAYDNA